MLHFRGVAKSRFRKGADVLLCIFGLVVMVYTTGQTVLSWGSETGKPALSYCDKKGKGDL